MPQGNPRDNDRGIHAARLRILTKLAGLGTTREFIEAQRDLVRDQSVLLRARVDLIKSHAQLDRAVGRTLQRQNIRIADALATNVQ